MRGEWLYMPTVLFCPWNKGYQTLLCPRLTKTMLPTVLLAFAETAYPSQPTPPEYMGNTSWTQSHWGPLEDAPAGPYAAHVSLSAVNRALWASSLITSQSEALGSSSRPCISCFSIHRQGSNFSSRLCNWHTWVASQRALSNSPSRQLGKSTPRCQRQSMPPCQANGNSPPVMPFQCYLVNYPPLPSLPSASTPRKLRPPGNTCYVLAPQAPLPRGYPVNYANCLAVPHCSLNPG